MLYLKQDSDKRLHQSQIQLSPYGQYYSSSLDNKEVNRLKDYRSFFAWTRSDRFYKPNKFFFEAGNSLTNSLATSLVKDTIRNQKRNDVEIADIITIGIGKGRIEQVQDAQMALYILNDLTAQALLRVAATKEQANDLAKLITYINTRRIFDFRKRRIYELTQLDSFLRNSGLATVTDIRHFTTLNDNWSLAINPYRLSGSNWYVKLKPGIQYKRNKISYADTINYSKQAETILSLSPVVGYEKYVPVSLNWQINWGASASFTTMRRNANNKTYVGTITNESTYHYTESTWFFNAFYSVGYFPTNRTQVNGNVNVAAYHYTNAYTALVPSLQITANYFLGYRTYLSGNFITNYNRFTGKMISSSSPDRNFTTDLSVKFTHILF